MKDDKNQRKTASALRYDATTDNAPVITASGKGAIAEMIIRKAEEHGLAIVKDPPLANLLAAIPLGTEIPVDLYEVVAEILAQILKLDKK